MKKIYLVYYDNGQSYDLYEYSVKRIFSSKESADKYAKEENGKRSAPFQCMSKEEYYMQDSDLVTMSYEEYLENEHFEWSEYSIGKYSVVEEIVCD